MTKTIGQTVKADGVRRFYSARGGFLGEAKRVKFGEWVYSGPGPTWNSPHTGGL